MKKPDFRALCAELTDALADFDDSQLYHEAPALIARARAALAEGDGVGVKDEELTALVRVFHVAYNAKRTELCALPNRYQHDTESDMADRAGLRAVLARYGTHPRPIPVAERPWERSGFLDDNGDAWFDQGDDVGWMLCDPVYGLRYGSRFCLPAAAIPLPEA